MIFTRRLGLAALIALWLSPAAGASAQATLDRPLRVFLDCNGFHCEQAFFVEEIPWVSFVRDRQDADVHILGTRQPTGGGGGAVTFEFRGRGALEGERLTLHETTAADATEAEVRTALVELTRLGLAPFAARTPAVPRLEILPPAADVAEIPTEVADPWDRWTFRLGVDGFMNGESKQQFLNTYGSASGSRVTEGWKVGMSLSASLSDSRFELNDSTTFTTSRESYSAEALVARSVRGQWAVGGIGSWSRSTFNNYRTSVRLAPAVEYNVFPYAESTRRLLTVLYSIGPGYNAYRKPTIFGENAEALLEQLLVVSYDVTQPWGNVDVSGRVTHYIAKIGDGSGWPDPQYNATVSGGFDVRLIKGLSARIHGNFQMVRGQIHLPAAGLTEEEILTRQRELATAYRYFFSFGLGYRFGSIFSDVVNPRFDTLD